MNVREKVSNKKRLIDVDALWCKLESEHWYDNADRDEIALPLVDNAPTVDAVEVVRCRDCFYYTPVDDNTGKCVFLIGEHQYVVPDGYCYLGELKEGID